MIFEAIGIGDEQTRVSEFDTTSWTSTTKVICVNGWHWLEVGGKGCAKIASWGTHGNTLSSTIWSGNREWHTKEGGLVGSSLGRTIVSTKPKGWGWEADVGSTQLVFKGLIWWSSSMLVYTFRKPLTMSGLHLRWLFKMAT